MRQQPDQDQRRRVAAPELLGCAWRRDPGDGGGRCGAHVPASAALEAWCEELADGRRSDGFFHFAWGNGTWLAYGAPDGGIRGAYCPLHSSELPPV
jgi:hypothetical protein